MGRNERRVTWDERRVTWDERCVTWDERRVTWDEGLEERGKDEGLGIRGKG